MDQQSPLQEAVELHGADAMGIAANMMLRYLYNAMPDPPVSPAAPLASAVAARAPGDDAVDRISGLPDQILTDVVSRLPAKSAVRTGALASRWRGIWRAVPLALVDSDVFPDSVPTRMARDEFVSRAVVIEASSALAAHPGPFRCFYLTSVTWSRIASHEAEIARWLRILAAQGVEELVFINRPWPFDLPLPAALFSCTALTRLHLGLWKFPDTTALPRTAGFPHLRELVLSVLMQDEDLAFMLNRSPALEFLTIIASQSALRLRLVSRSLRFLQLCMCGLAEIDVVDAPRLERLFLMRNVCRKNFSRVRIGNAPNLHMLGYWQPDRAELEITNSIIQACTRVSESTIVPSVQILALEVEFELRNEVKMVPCFLKCFPNVETLYVYSSNSEKSTVKPNLKFWQESSHIACVQSHLN